jgi:hypothetical protein
MDDINEFQSMFYCDTYLAAGGSRSIELLCDRFWAVESVKKRTFLGQLP